MKKYYKISEISKLYGIGLDSLRYYEKIGLLHPSRDHNGYRLYDLKDIYKLTIIKELRQLHFTMPQIKTYLDHQSLYNTLHLLEEENKLLEKEILTLKQRQAMIEQHLRTLEELSLVPVNKITIKTYPQRYCLGIEQSMTTDEEMDFMIKVLHRKYENQVEHLSNQQIGAFISLDAIKQGIANTYSFVFFILDFTNNPNKILLPEGLYLSYYYHGPYQQHLMILPKMFDYMQQHHYQRMGEPFEIYHIDNRDTLIEEEFLTEILIPIKKEAD